MCEGTQVITTRGSLNSQKGDFLLWYYIIIACADGFIDWNRFSGEQVSDVTHGIRLKYYTRLRYGIKRWLIMILCIH